MEKCGNFIRMFLVAHAQMWPFFVECIKGPSKNVNIFMSVQTVHFFRPPPSVQTNIFGFQNMGFTQNIYCTTTQINPYFKPVWYVTSDSLG